jgi:hypothetical protein
MPTIILAIILVIVTAQNVAKIILETMAFNRNFT